MHVDEMRRSRRDCTLEARKVVGALLEIAMGGSWP